MLLRVVALLALSASAGVLAHSAPLPAPFLAWHARFKGSDGSEKAVRAAYGESEAALIHAASNFAASVDRVQHKNLQSVKMNSTARFGLNAFSDLAPKEFREKYLMKPRPALSKEDAAKRDAKVCFFRLSFSPVFFSRSSCLQTKRLASLRRSRACRSRRRRIGWTSER
jgi:Cathepsin propeptide inhibitor domain (I29)